MTSPAEIMYQLHPASAPPIRLKPRGVNNDRSKLHKDWQRVQMHDVDEKCIAASTVINLSFIVPLHESCCTPSYLSFFFKIDSACPWQHSPLQLNRFYCRERIYTGMYRFHDIALPTLCLLAGVKSMTVPTIRANLNIHQRSIPSPVLPTTSSSLPEITPLADLRKRADRWIEVCPYTGATSGCDVIGVHQIFPTGGGEFVPVCDQEGYCSYLPYAQATGPISSLSYQITTASSGEDYVIAVPVPLPLGEVLPPVPVGDPEGLPEAPEDDDPPWSLTNTLTTSSAPSQSTTPTHSSSGSTTSSSLMQSSLSSSSTSSESTATSSSGSATSSSLTGTTSLSSSSSTSSTSTFETSTQESIASTSLSSSLVSASSIDSSTFVTSSSTLDSTSSMTSTASVSGTEETTSSMSSANSTATSSSSISSSSESCALPPEITLPPDSSASIQPYQPNSVIVVGFSLPPETGASAPASNTQASSTIPPSSQNSTSVASESGAHGTSSSAPTSTIPCFANSAGVLFNGSPAANPETWCVCSNTGIYPTLTASGSIPNCAYTSLPGSMISLQYPGQSLYSDRPTSCRVVS